MQSQSRKWIKIIRRSRTSSVFKDLSFAVYYLLNEDVDCRYSSRSQLKFLIRTMLGPYLASQPTCNHALNISIEITRVGSLVY